MVLIEYSAFSDTPPNLAFAPVFLLGYGTFWDLPLRIAADKADSARLLNGAADGPLVPVYFTSIETENTIAFWYCLYFGADINGRHQHDFQGICYVYEKGEPDPVAVLWRNHFRIESLVLSGQSESIRPTVFVESGSHITNPQATLGDIARSRTGSALVLYKYYFINMNHPDWKAQRPEIEKRFGEIVTLPTRWDDDRVRNYVRKHRQELRLIEEMSGEQETAGLAYRNPLLFLHYSSKLGIIRSRTRAPLL